MIFKKQLKNFVSEIDLFLNEFDSAHPEKSLSQENEIAKYQKIAELRDKATPSKADPFDF